MFRGVFHAAAWLLLASSRFANADCECGYSVNKTSDADHAVFIDLLETDFLHINTENLTEYGWRPQEYNVSSADARGPFGKQFVVENLETNALKDGEWSGKADHDGDAGLQLWVRGDNSNGFVSGAEMASERTDFRLGSFRVGMKLAGAAGTCGAFFYFHNDSQEIDMEFLSKQFKESGGAVNLVLQSPESIAHGYDASNTSAFEVMPLPFRPDDQFHEYRFDWTEDKVTFYVDGEYIHEMHDHIPVEAGHLFMNHWSNGDKAWSAGPPMADTPLTVSYIKAYFNSTDPERMEAHKDRCGTFDPKKVCEIPAQKGAPNGDKAQTYFFSTDGDKVDGQITYSAASSLGSSIFTYVPLLAAVAFFAL